MMSAVFIDRPRLAMVVAFIITIAGALALTRIPVAQFPDIVPPQVTVAGTFPGASAEVVETSVAQPLEAQVIGVDRALYMKSTSGNDGSYTLTVSFALGTDPDINTVNVNNRVQSALSQLPTEVQQQGVTVQKKSSAILQFLVLYSAEGQQDPLFITNYAIINVLDAISSTPGVGQAHLFAKMNYSMRIWFDTQRLTSLQSHALGRDRSNSHAERPGAGRPHRCASDQRRPAIPVQRADPGAARNGRPVRQYRAARKPGRFDAARQGRRPGRDGRAEP
ncbi:multidrug efflux pump subunit AcrB [Bradyrhizobium sp. LM3.2]